MLMTQRLCSDETLLPESGLLIVAQHLVQSTGGSRFRLMMVTRPTVHTTDAVIHLLAFLVAVATGGWGARALDIGKRNFISYLQLLFFACFFLFIYLLKYLYACLVSI